MTVPERLQSESTCALIVDVQERLYPHMLDADTLDQRIARLVHGLQLLDVPLLATEQYPKGLGQTVETVKAAFGSPTAASGEGTRFDPVEKVCFSCMDSDGLAERLSTLGRKSVVIAGIETHVCVQQTAQDLLRAGYEAIIVSDCVSSRKQLDRDVALEHLRSVGARVTTTEAVLFELCRYAGTDTFKQISRLVK